MAIKIIEDANSTVTADIRRYRCKIEHTVHDKRFSITETVSMSSETAVRIAKAILKKYEPEALK